MFRTTSRGDMRGVEGQEKHSECDNYVNNKGECDSVWIVAASVGKAELLVHDLASIWRVFGEYLDAIRISGIWCKFTYLRSLAISGDLWRCSPTTRDDMDRVCGLP